LRAFADPDTPQRRAASPLASVWVSASAGTGKTRVLIDRLLWLMLDGTDPGAILCLTFTRAGAAEMANRLNAELANWATLQSGALAESLRRLTGRMPGDAEIARARQLFARVLETPGGIKISTIHAFCQTLLRRFPLEAGISTEFAVIDERSAREALSEAGGRVINAARDADEPGLAEALEVVARHAPEERFGTLMAALAAERGKLGQVLSRGHAELRNQLCRVLGLAAGATEEAVIDAFCAADATDEAALRRVAGALAGGSRSDQERSAVIAEWCENQPHRRHMLVPYASVFLTAEGEVRKILITQDAARSADGDTQVLLCAEAERVKMFCEARRAAALVEASCALIRLGGALMEAYADLKRAQGVLDYDDLIAAALGLLRRPGIAPWVLFKLDGGLDHILIDEAQDTNPEQWEIVAALTEEFFAGEGADNRLRTVFAVGDSKQSIYSFQRADPRAFFEMREHFERRIDEARREWRIVPLDVSFRSTEPVLEAIDTIFHHQAARDGVSLDGSEIRHIAARTGHAGVVELWPLVVGEPEEPPDPIALPVIRQRIVEPRTRLANAIATTIADWIAKEELLEAFGRPIRPADIMVLVRRRNEFVGELLRALKQRNIPVAGADRLILTEQLAVQDLVALGRFLLLPEDDLTLATVLKGPLFGIDEETLFDLAYDRGRETLWQRLRGKAEGCPQVRDAADRLSGLLARADFVPPYELYAEILGAGGGRRMLLERLGVEADDPVEEFLALALSYEREHVPSLQGFLRWVAAGDTEVKRDFGAKERDEVRILTVHGAKGLEAPVVFLPDTTRLPNQPETLMWTERGGLPIWCPRRDFAAPFFTAEKRALRARQLQEYRRLLYVALSRAQDRLYICGWQKREAAAEESWFALCRTGLAGKAIPFAFDTAALIGADGWRGEGLRLATAQTVSPIRGSLPVSTSDARPLPAWVRKPAAAEPDPPRPLAPSRPREMEPPGLSPLALMGRDRFKRGLLVHRLLQSLPELPMEEREAAAQRFLASPAHGLPLEEQVGIRRDTLAVLNHPDFAALFGPGSQAEVQIVGLIRATPGTERVLSGQIDRLLVTADRVLVVDYKTLRLPPATEAAVAPPYLRQLSAYRAALAQIYPDREIHCALLWTEGPRLMPISPSILASYPP